MIRDRMVSPAHFPLKGRDDVVIVARTRCLPDNGRGSVARTLAPTRTHPDSRCRSSEPYRRQSRCRLRPKYFCFPPCSFQKRRRKSREKCTISLSLSLSLSLFLLFFLSTFSRFLIRRRTHIAEGRCTSRFVLARVSVYVPRIVCLFYARALLWA